MDALLGMIVLVAGGALLWHELGSSSTTASAAPASSSTGTGGGSPIPDTGGAAPSGSIFGLAPGGPGYDAIVQGYSPQVTAADNAGLAYAGGGPAVHDWDYATALGTAVRLPGTSSQVYHLARVYYQQGVGWIEAWTGHNGPVIPGQAPAVFEFVHLSRETAGQAGAIGHGGDIVGYSGAPTPGAGYGAGAQLAVIVDQAGARLLQGLP